MSDYPGRLLHSPEGQDFPNVGCYLDIVPNERLVWTNAMGPGYRPATRPADESCDAFAFAAVISLEPHGAGTKYRALLIHGNEAERNKHDAMRFQDGWGKALEQLIAVAKKM